MLDLLSYFANIITSKMGSIFKKKQSDKFELT